MEKRAHRSDGDIADGGHDEVGVALALGRVTLGGDGDALHAGGLRRGDSCGRVLEDDAAGGIDAHLGCGEQEALGVGLRTLHIAAGDDGVEGGDELEAVDRALHIQRRARRADGGAEAGGAQRRDEIARAVHDREADRDDLAVGGLLLVVERRDLVGRELAAARAQPALAQEILVAAAEVGVVVVDGDRDAVARADEAPGLEVGVVAVDEGSVEVEDGGVHGGGAGGGRWNGRWVGAWTGWLGVAGSEGRCGADRVGGAVDVGARHIEVRDHAHATGAHADRRDPVLREARAELLRMSQAARHIRPRPPTIESGPHHERSRQVRHRRGEGRGGVAGAVIHGARHDTAPRPGRAMISGLMKLILANPRGFCAGVYMAIDVVDQLLDICPGEPIYVYHEIVHNGHVVGDLASRGAIFVDDIAEIPEGSLTIFSAHGVANAVVEHAARRRLRVIDATCPLVTKVHVQAERYSQRGHVIVVIGHAGHEEVEGTRGSVSGPVHVVGSLEDIAALPMPSGTPVAYVTQTTLSLDDTRVLIEALERRYPDVIGPGLEDICYATQNRQRAVRQMARQVDLVIVVGARNSSNANRLQEVAADHGVPARLVEHAGELEPVWLAEVRTVGVTAGASTPEILVTGVCERLRELGAGAIRELPGLAETTRFRLPEILRRAG